MPWTYRPANLLRHSAVGSAITPAPPLRSCVSSAPLRSRYSNTPPWRRPLSSRAHQPRWRPSTVLDAYVETPARPISLRQLIFFGSRNLDEKRILNSANYVRTELPIRIAHRIRDMQKLPYVVVTNRHLSYVYELYYEAFDAFRKVPEIKTVEDNDRFCDIIRATLIQHLTVIPRLAMGVLECREHLPAEQLDRFMNSLLRSRISRRVIAEQHLALTDTFNSPEHFPDSKHNPNDFVGEVFLRCSAQEVVSRVGRYTQDLTRNTKGPVPEILLEGHLDTTFPYILSHLEYIIGELLRNSIEATIEQHPANPPPINVLICNAPKHIIFRVSDQGGGIPPDEVDDLWSFAKQTRSDTRIKNFEQVPKMSATLQELRKQTTPEGSLHSLTYRPPDLKLGMGLPMGRVYAEYWGGSLEQTSMNGYGTDVFLHIEKLGNRLEQLNIDSL